MVGNFMESYLPFPHPSQFGGGSGLVPIYFPQARESRAEWNFNVLACLHTTWEIGFWFIQLWAQKKLRSQTKVNSGEYQE